MRHPTRAAGLDPELDARLVERCLGGDERAWAALVRRYERLVYAVGRSYRLSDDDLADVFQEVFAALVRGLPRLRDARSLCRWLASTTERIALATALRRRRERGLHSDDGNAPLDDLPSADAPVGAAIEDLEGQMMVRLALGALSPRCRGLLEALYYADPPGGYREIARAQRIPVGSIGPTRARCLERLRAALLEIEAEDGGISRGGDRTSRAKVLPSRRIRMREESAR